MQAGDRQVGHVEKRIDAVDAAARHDRDRAVRAASQLVEQRRQRTGHVNAVGCRGELDERAVEVEEERGIGQRQGGRNGLHRFDV